MPRNASKDLMLREERKGRMLRAALKLFVERGLKDTKISDIAKATGLSHGLVYHYFESKEEIYKTLIIKSIGCLKDEAEQLLLSPEGTPWDKLCTLVRNAVINCDDNEVAHLYLALEQQVQSFSNLEEPFRNKIFQTYEEKQMPISEIIRQGQRIGQLIDGDPDQLAILVHTVMQGMILANMRGMAHFDEAAVARTMRLFIRK